MSSDDISNLIQTLAVLAAVGAAIVALVISAKDRRNARQIAADDRREALRQAHLLFELEHLVRLSQNNNRGGSTDPIERKQLGAEALTMIGALGETRVPSQWNRRVGNDEKLQAAMTDAAMPEFKKDALETQLAVNAVLREIRASIGRE
ncbi:MAG TPA: hypothetical protein VNJ54_21180 [Plantibacter sp.]|uniref:hypothetical protein n=1 Tax=unclassified Plantibacter TaxID=2624265 RepID=UPI002CCA2221|nr:hypothetical protein [Plantibacter sp.]